MNGGGVWILSKASAQNAEQPLLCLKSAGPVGPLSFLSAGWQERNLIQVLKRPVGQFGYLYKLGVLSCGSSSCTLSSLLFLPSLELLIRVYLQCSNKHNEGRTTDSSEGF